MASIIKATKPTSMKQALARIQDHLNDIDSDVSHLTAYEQEQVFIDFAMAVHYAAREDVIDANRNFRLWLTDKLYSDFPHISNYTPDGGWCGTVAYENGFTA